MKTLAKRESPTPRRWFEQGPLASLRGEMDELFESFFGEKGVAATSSMLVPSIDVSETDDTVEVKTDLPGFKAEEVDIEIRDNYLTVSGSQTEETESETDNGRKFHRLERRKGSFSRSVWLPCDVQQDKVEAELNDGVLTVTMPKAEEAKSRKISIKGS